MQSRLFQQSLHLFHSNGSSRLLGTVLLISAFPTIYQSIRVYFLGALPADWGYNIAAQLSWVSLIFEVIQEGFMLPLFFLLGQAIHQPSEFSNRVRTGLSLTIFVYGVLAVLLVAFAPMLTRFMAQKPELVAATVTYIRLETLGIWLAAPLKFCSIVFLLQKDNRALLTVLGLQVFLSILLDTLFVSQLDISFKLGVNGIAWSNIISSSIILWASYEFLRRKGIVFFKSYLHWDLGWFKGWLKIGAYSGLESLVRNLAFVLMIVRMMNLISEQGTYWLANNFIWGWLLLPILALAEVVKRNSAEKPEEVLKMLPAYVLITTGIILLWLATSGFWLAFFRDVLALQNPKKVLQLVHLSILFYVIFAYNNLIDSIFYGLGRTDLMLFQSLMVNLLLYGAAYGLYLSGYFQPSIINITILFGLGIVFDTVITFIMYYRIRKSLSN